MISSKIPARRVALVAFWIGYAVFPYLSGINAREELECIYPLRYAARSTLMWAAYFSIGVFAALRASASLRQQADSKLMYGLAWLLPVTMSISSVANCP